MSVTRDDVVSALLPDEPRYDAAAKLGPDVLPHLQELVRGDDPNLASKAASLATRIKDPRSLDVLADASGHSHVVVRIAADGVRWRLGRFGIGDLVARQLADNDPQVRLLAVNSAVRAPAVPHVEERLQAMALRDPVPEIRTRAADVLRRTGRLERLRGVIRGEKPPGSSAS